MRPVDKGDGTAYTASIPASFNFAAYQGAKKVAFQYCVANNLIVPNPVGTSTVTTANCLAFWLQVVEDGLKTKPKALRTVPQKNRLVVQGMILDKVTTIYKQAGVPMVQTIGDFCCYCDTPIPGLLEVEHRCPKSQYPTFSMDWENFLMSCGPCNNTKRDNPDRATVLGWMGAPPTDEEDYQTEINHYYVWADIDANPYGYIVPALYYNDNGTWEEVIGDYALNLNNIVVSYDLANRLVRANLYATGEADELNIEVSVRVKSIAAGTRGQIIDLCGLNNPGNTDSTYDRRMVNRTKAWFTVLATLKPFSLLDFSGPQGQQTFDILWNSVLITAASTGFYSVWFNILKKYKDPSGVNLDKRFVLESNHPNLFPGTNTALVY